MSLLEYDIIKPVDKTKTWIDIKNRLLLSKEIINRMPYYNLSSKYNTVLHENDYYLIIGNKPPLNYRINYDNYGRAKFNINSIFDKIGANKSKVNFNITLTYIETNDGCDIYKIDI